ncbi:MAG: acyltransferase [Candidatus Eremiobacteraeota bacterium]|nr:acyltransferase [Candidatus Eremiobacteraeota bacterium]
MREALALLRSRFKTAFGSFKTQLFFLRRHPDATLASGVLLFGTERITAGRKLFIDHRAYLTTGTLNGRQGFIRLGDNVEIGPYAVLWGAGGIEIGNNVHIGAHVSITAHEARQMDADRIASMEPLEFDFEPVVIEDHVLICSGTQIVPGVRIGHHAMIGGGSVVVSDIPPYALAVGSPARPIRFINRPAASDRRPLHLA